MFEVDNQGKIYEKEDTIEFLHFQKKYDMYNFYKRHPVDYTLFITQMSFAESMMPQHEIKKDIERILGLDQFKEEELKPLYDDSRLKILQYYHSILEKGEK